MHYLVIRFSGMGDVVMSLAVLASLREKHPDVEISYITDIRNQGLLEASRMVDRVFYFDRARFKASSFSHRWRMIKTLLREIRAYRYDIALEMQSFGETGVLARLSRAPQRFGYLKRKSQKLWINRPLDPMKDCHRISYFMQFSAGKPGIVDPVLKRPPLIPLMNGSGQSSFDSNRVALFVGASQPVRQWDIQNFITLAKKLSQRGYEVVMIGGPGEAPLLENIELSSRVHTRITMHIEELIKLLSECGHLVCGDTGPLHLAGALGVPHLVGLYAPHNVNHSTPMYSNRFDLVAREPLNEIDVGTVEQLILQSM